ncbi:putative MFS family arabinose efflux permease [Haloactinopolyspora alba]|uniref:Putative MFS family arabinose efflux permease n=1 Tax=Haloactinopolyspora alba TaxID=648780 RepID=A0A2P8EG40_9ACTN|nr:MFS transporter [Haloactinopolyspora alba]PSL08438.1 putative MFS family arabinose efflux permease [Haloactinopolyspora alba]
MSPPKFDLWSIGPSVYLPSLLFGVGYGGIVPVIPLSARDLGASVATAGLVVAFLGVGRIIGDLPAGMLAIRMGERRAMLVALGVTVAALSVCIAATSVVVLVGAVVFLGFSAAVFGLARHAYLAEVMPYEQRGRALSTLGGTNRVGMFLGPFLGAAMMKGLGTDGGYWLHVVMAVAAAVVLMVVADPPSARSTAPRPQDRASRIGMRQVIRQQAPVLRTLGVAAMLVGAARASREVAIPLWGDHIGLSPATTSLVFGISGGVEMLMFYPAGMIMDRFGRRWVVVPAMLILGTSLGLLPLTGGIGTYAAVAVLMGFGNGLGSGIIMTIGADVSPDGGRAAFLGAWRLFSDVGNGLGPLAVSAVTALATLAVAVAAAGAIAYVGAALMARWIPRPNGQ